MALASLYMDTPKVDISGTIAGLRREESDRKAKNWKSAQDLLRGAATDAIRSKYADQIDWDQGVEHADKVFKVQYERLMAVDPQAAAQLAQEYKVEREKRINKQVSDAYKAREEDLELKALEAEIAALGASIQSEEIETKRQESLRAPQEEAMQGYKPESTVYKDETGITQSAQRHAEFQKYDRAARARERVVSRQEDLMYGYRPNDAGMPTVGSSSLTQLYGNGPYAPSQLSPSEAGTYGMQNYRPLNAWYKGGR